MWIRRPFAWCRRHDPVKSAAKVIALTTGLIASTLTGACAPHGPKEIRTFSGPVGQAVSYIATYSTMGANFTHNFIVGQNFFTSLTSIDGMQVQKDFLGPRYITTLPDDHTVSFQVKSWSYLGSSRYYSEGRIKFYTNSGMHYAVISFIEHRFVADEGVFIWVHEFETNTVVGGSAPPGFKYSCKIVAIASAAECHEQ